MKKIIAIFVLAFIALVFCSCGNKGASDAENAELDRQAELSEITEETSSVTETVTQIIETVIDEATEVLESTSERINSKKVAQSSAAATVPTTVFTTVPTTVPTTASTTAPTTVPTTASTAAPTTVPTTATFILPTNVLTTASTTTVQRTRPTYGQKFSFSTTDINGKAVSLADYSYADVIMVNMWEPWCGPCVREMPDLQRLYEKYKGRGFLILGAFQDDDSSAKEIIDEIGITYPVIKRTSEFARFGTQYVPTTFFIDGNGNVLSEESYIGGRSFSDWEKIILSYLDY